MTTLDTFETYLYFSILTTAFLLHEFQMKVFIF